MARQAAVDAGAFGQWVRDARLSGYPIIVVGLIVVALVVLAPGLKTLIEQRQQIGQLQQQVDDAQHSVDDLTGEIARWSDPKYVEAQARDRLFYVYPGDKSYLVVGNSAAEDDAPVAEVSDEIQQTDVNWVGSLLATLYTAGLTEATPDELKGAGK